MRFANVAIPSPLRGLLTYALPEGMIAAPGMRVATRFRNKQSIGVIVSICDELPDEAASKSIKPIDALLDSAPVMNESMLGFISWMSSYYCAPIGEVIRTALPGRLMKPGAPKTTRPTAPHEMVAADVVDIELNPDQQRALDDVLRAGAAHRVFLLHGVTGSGKTEVYLRIFAKLAEEGRQGLLLVPEIGLTSQLTGRAAARFKDRVAVYHSGLTDAQRHEQWQRMQAGAVDVVIGTRSAVFAPLPRLGAIVVDEEHDSSYKQDEGFSYHGRDCAVMRAHRESIPAILGSATPSLESIANARSDKYTLLSLPVRTGSAAMPSIEVVDMRLRNEGVELREEAKGFSSLSPRLHRAIDETLAREEQALIFLGRRGFSSIHCEACGAALSCPNCDIALTSHVGACGERLICHFCDYAIPTPSSCPECKGAALAPIGRGTQRIEAEIADFFPTARIARLDSDMAASQKERHRIFTGMRKGTIDILVGTQMVTKGHDFPNVTLVGVISADQSLHLPDFRAAERTFQLLTQVAGRAGRAKRPGTVIVQTYEPEHPSLICSCSHDFDGFTSYELDCRKALRYPPFSRLANMRFSSLEKELASKSAHAAAAALRHHSGTQEGLQILGPAPAPIEKLRGRYRWQLLIKASGAPAMAKLLSRSLPEIERTLPRKVRFSLDVDPANLV
jgi:primosomal protein N' (replication factor Y)